MIHIFNVGQYLGGIQSLLCSPPHKLWSISLKLPSAYKQTLPDIALTKSNISIANKELSIIIRILKTVF